MKNAFKRRSIIIAIILFVIIITVNLCEYREGKNLRRSLEEAMREKGTIDALLKKDPRYEHIYISIHKVKPSIYGVKIHGFVEREGDIVILNNLINANDYGIDVSIAVKTLPEVAAPPRATPRVKPYTIN